jgi:hypothetical protein
VPAAASGWFMFAGRLFGSAALLTARIRCGAVAGIDAIRARGAGQVEATDWDADGFRSDVCWFDKVTVDGCVITLICSDVEFGADPTAVAVAGSFRMFDASDVEHLDVSVSAGVARLKMLFYGGSLTYWCEVPVPVAEQVGAAVSAAWLQR